MHVTNAMIPNKYHYEFPLLILKTDTKLDVTYTDILTGRLQRRNRSVEHIANNPLSNVINSNWTNDTSSL